MGSSDEVVKVPHVKNRWLWGSSYRVSLFYVVDSPRVAC